MMPWSGGTNMKLSTLMVALLVHYTKSSYVIDSLSQKGVYVSDYCPKMKYCAEGAHVMCMYYNPNHIMGPRCNRPKNVSITPDLADKLLEVSNAIRSKIALGREKGKGGDLLPKGYGMFKLKWDNELATFAQVLANQCVLRHDLCRASKKFSDPGQTAGLVRFTYPEWFPVSKAGHFTKPGLTPSKLSYAITQTLKSWYGQKDAVTPFMISNYPDWAENPNNQGGRLYLEMIYGPATHMGCGISAYTEYAYYDNNAALNYNSVQVICNYSSRPRQGGSVYQTNPPTEVGYTIRCGCPIGMDEDADCLCIESQRNAITASPSTRTCSENGHCKPAVVLLPIFTVENAPPEKLAARSGYEMSQFDRKEPEVEISDLYGPTDNTSTLRLPENEVPESNIQSVLGNIMNDALPKSNLPVSLLSPSMVDFPLPASTSPKKSTRISYYYSNLRVKEPQSVISSLVDEAKRNVEFRISTSHRPLIRDVKKRVFRKNPPHLGYNLMTVRPTLNHYQPKRESLFSKVATFELPKLRETIIKPDVQPRKDFSHAKNLVEEYLNLKKDHKDSRKIFYQYERHGEDLNTKTTTERFLHSAEDKVINYNYYLKNDTQQAYKPTQSGFESDTNLSKEKTNDKLMNLLDKLEQEVKYIELDRNKKEIFDARIRKIYGTVVGEPTLITYKSDHETDFTDIGDMTDVDRYESNLYRHSDVDSKSHIKKPHYKSDSEDLPKNVENIHSDKFSEFENEIRPLSRSQSSVYVDHLKQRNNKKTTDGYESDIKHHYSDVEELKAKLQKGIFGTDNDIKSDHIYSDKEDLRTRHVYSDNEGKKTKYPENKRKFFDENDLLGVDRRRYYQSKLEHLERKLHSTRGVKHHEANTNRLIRPVLPTVREEQSIRPSKSQPDTFYMPDRARFLHGF